MKNHIYVTDGGHGVYEVPELYAVLVFVGTLVAGSLITLGVLGVRGRP